MTTSAPIHISGLFPELLGIGGIQEAGRLTALALSEIAQNRGYSFRFAALNDPNGRQTISVAGHMLDFEGYARDKKQFIRSALKSSRSTKGIGAEIVLVGHPNFAPIAAWIQFRSQTARTIVMAHGIEVWKPLSFIRRTSLKYAGAVTAPSTDTAQKLIDVQRVTAGRVRKLPWPLNPDFLSLSEPARQLQLPLPVGFPQGKVVLTIGRAEATEQYKGTDSLIKSIAGLRQSFPDLHLVIVGGGNDLPRLKSLVSELTISEHVHFLENLSREEIAACYSACEIFAMPSAGEGFGLVFLEAMAFAKPVVAANSGGAIDIVQHEANGLLVPPRDTNALALALRRLVEDSSLRSALGENGAAFVGEKHSFPAFRTQLEVLIEECLMDSLTSK